MTDTQTRFLAGGLLLLCGCPAATPFAFNETARVLRSGQVAVTATGGVGGQVDKQPQGEKNPAVGGGGLRIRGGIGGGQELGVDTLLAGYSKDGVLEFSAGGKLAYKVSLAPAAAFLLGVGLTYRRMTLDMPPIRSTVANSLSPGGDIGVVLSPPRPLLRVLVPYLGFRLGLFASFIGYDESSFNLSDGTFGLFTPQVAPGLAIVPAKWLKLTAELGYLGSLTFQVQGKKPDHSYSSNLYGSAAATFVFGE